MLECVTYLQHPASQGHRPIKLSKLIKINLLNPDLVTTCVCMLRLCVPEDERGEAIAARE